MTKRVWLAEGLPTPRFVRLAADEQHAASSVRAVPDELGLPLIVKPPREGSSIGVTKVAGYSQMQDAVELAAALRRRRAVRGVHRGRRGDLPGARRRRRRARAAGGPHRRARRRLRLPEQVLHRRRAATSARAACRADEEAEIQRIVAGRLPRARLPRLGPRRPDDPRQRPQALPARDEHLARHDRPFAGADVGARRRHQLRAARACSCCAAATLRSDPARRVRHRPPERWPHAPRLRPRRRCRSTSR